MMDSILFLFCFILLFYFFILDLRLGFSMVSQSQQSYDHMSLWKKIEGSRRNDTATIYLTYVKLEDNLE